MPVQGRGDREEGGNCCGAAEGHLHETAPRRCPRCGERLGLNLRRSRSSADLARTTAEEFIGEVMVYSIAEAIVEWLQANNRPELDGSAYPEMMERSRIAKEKSDAAKAAAEQEAEAARKAESATDSGIRKRLGTMLT